MEEPEAHEQPETISVEPSVVRPIDPNAPEEHDPTTEAAALAAAPAVAATPTSASIALSKQQQEEGIWR
jgi:hypothetical protein